MEFDIDLEGLDAMAQAMGERLDDVLPAAMKGVAKATQRVAKDARLLVPVDSGDLQKHIRARSPKINGDAIEASVVANTEYAVYVEYGTGVKGAGSTLPEGMPPATYRTDWNGQAAQPFMYPAMKKNEQATKATIASEIRKAVEE